MESNNSNFSVTLNVYEWHTLISKLDYFMTIHAPIDERNKTIELWENISTQLNNKEMIIQGSDKHKRLNPESYNEYITDLCSKMNRIDYSNLVNKKSENPETVKKLTTFQKIKEYINNKIDTFLLYMG